MPAAPRLYLRKAARADIAEAFRWYEARGTGLGFEFLRAVRVALAGIERAPEQYPIALGDIRKALLPRFPYVVYFVLHTRGVSVIRDARPAGPAALAIASLTYNVRWS